MAGNKVVYKSDTIPFDAYISIINKRSEYTSVQAGTKITGIVCESCHKVFSKRADEFKKRNICLCKPCMIKRTCMAKYGVYNPMQVDDIKKKCIETNLRKYGFPSHNQSDIVKQKKAMTFMKHYGVTNIFALQDFKHRMEITNLFKYGCYNPAQCDEIKKKIRETNLRRYNKEYYSQTDEFKSRFKSTCMERYGTDHFNKSLFFNHRSHIYFDGYYFDSKAELDFYKKCLFEGKKIIVHPLRLEYEYKNHIHYYYPDFEVDGVLVEIKGIHFYDRDNDTWTNPFNEKDIERQQARCECAKRNNVKIIYV